MKTIIPESRFDRLFGFVLSVVTPGGKFLEPPPAHKRQMHFLLSEYRPSKYIYYILISTEWKYDESSVLRTPIKFYDFWSWFKNHTDFSWSLLPPVASHWKPSVRKIRNAAASGPNELTTIFAAGVKTILNQSKK